MTWHEEVVTIHEDALLREAKLWLIKEYGEPRDLDPEERDRWHADLGMFVCFIRDLFQKGREAHSAKEGRK